MGTNPHHSTAVITIAYERRTHLSRQRDWLQRSVPGVEHVIVDMGGEPLRHGSETVIELPVPPADALPLAAARNMGARSTDADVLIFLDVDCLPVPGLVSAYRRQVTRHGGIWAGPVGYLSPADEIADWSVASLLRSAHFHAGRPQPGQVPAEAISPDMFWSLSFAIKRTDWDVIGGFDERFVGYGGEDTDFARTATCGDIALWFDGDAIAFHQHHPVSTPPFEHLDHIVANATTFHDKWGDWPMPGWLAAFRDAGAIDWRPDADRITTIVRSNR